MRSYSVAISALAIGSSSKWLDNLLSHFPVREVATARRGVARRVPYAALLHLSLTRTLHTELGLGVREALAIAEELLAAEAGHVTRGGHLRVTFDRGTLENEVNDRLRDALEFAPAPRRGRPARTGHASGT